MLEGKPTILGGDEVHVEQLQWFNENQAIDATSTKNSLSQKRFNFGLAEAPFSMFSKYEVIDGDDDADNDNENLCPEINFNNVNGLMHCENENQNRICVLNCDVGYVPSSVEIFICSLKQSKIHQWTTIGGQVLQNSLFVTCERPVAVIAGG